MTSAPSFRTKPVAAAILMLASAAFLPVQSTRRSV